MYNFAAFGVHHRLGPHQECKASWSVRLVPRKWHRKDALPPVTVVSANEIYYDHLWPISWLDGGFMFFQLSIFYLTWGVGGLKMFQGRSYLLPTLVLQPGKSMFHQGYQTHFLPVDIYKTKNMGIVLPFAIWNHQVTSFLFAKSSCCLRKSTCLPKGLYFHVLISMFLNCKGDGSPHEVMVDHTHFCGWTDSVVH